MMLFFRTLTLFLVVTSASGQTGCSVCGDGKAVTAPSAVFSFPSQPSIPCGMLQDAGMNGYIPLEQCVFLPPLLTMCGCAPSDGSLTTMAPLAVPPTEAPVLATPTEAPVVPPMEAPNTESPVVTPTEVPIVPPTEEPVIPETPEPSLQPWPKDLPYTQAPLTPSASLSPEPMPKFPDAPHLAFPPAVNELTFVPSTPLDSDDDDDDCGDENPVLKKKHSKKRRVQAPLVASPFLTPMSNAPDAPHFGFPPAVRVSATAPFAERYDDKKYRKKHGKKKKHA